MKVNKNKDIVKTMKKAATITMSEMKYNLIDVSDEISIFFQIMFPIIIFWYEGYLNSLLVFLLSLLFLLVTRVLTAFYRDMTDQGVDSIPLPVKRLTRRNERGFIELIDMNDSPEAIRYLYMLENHLESKGLIESD